MSDLILYGYPASTFVRTVRMACAEKGVPYSLDAFESFEFQGSVHRELHPFGKMPVMRHDEVVLFETLAICHYIDETFEGPSLTPEKLTDRCHMYQWISAINDAIYHGVVRKWIIPVLRKQDLTNEKRTQLRNAAREQLAMIDPHCGGDYLAGNSVSLADLFMAPVLAYALQLDEDLLAGSVNLGNIWLEISARNSFAATMS